MLGAVGMKWNTGGGLLISTPAPVEEVAGASANYVGAVEAVVISDIRANIGGGQGTADGGVRRDCIVQVFETNDPVVPNLHFRTHTDYDTGRVYRKGTGVGACIAIKNIKAVTGFCATETERAIEVIHIRSNDAETSTNAPQRIHFARKGDTIRAARFTPGAGVGAAERIPVALKTPKELTSLQLTSPLEATDEPLG